MSRRKKSIKRGILPDARYDSQTVSKFINAIMYEGKKSTAERIFYSAMDLVEQRTSQSGVTVFKQALTNLKPAVEVKSRRVGGANYQIPFPIQGHRQQHYAFMWLVQSARARSGMPYNERLAGEIVDAFNETGAAFKKKEDTHRMAEANRAFAHFARG